jgi:hypothetical protein
MRHITENCRFQIIALLLSHISVVPSESVFFVSVTGLLTMSIVSAHSQSSNQGEYALCHNTGCGISQLTAAHFVGGHILGN